MKYATNVTSKQTVKITARKITNPFCPTTKSDKPHNKAKIQTSIMMSITRNDVIVVRYCSIRRMARYRSRLDTDRVNISDNGRMLANILSVIPVGQ